MRGQLPRIPSGRDAKVSIGSEAARDSCAVELASVLFAPLHLLLRWRLLREMQQLLLQLLPE